MRCGAWTGLLHLKVELPDGSRAWWQRWRPMCLVHKRLVQTRAWSWMVLVRAVCVLW